MHILILNPAGRPIGSLVRTFERHRIWADVAASAEHAALLLQRERYAGIICFASGDDAAARSLCERWQQAGRHGLLTVILHPFSLVGRARMLEMGADECLGEPFSYLALLAAVLAHAYSRPSDPPACLRLGPFTVDPLARTVRQGERELPLTRTEFDLLSLFLRWRGRVLSRDQIWEEVWGNRDYPLANTIDVHVARLRRKLRACREGVIRTVYGIGYRMAD